MFLLVGNLIKSMVTTVNWALEGLFPGVCPQVVEEALWLLEKFPALRMIAGVHCGLPLSVREWVTKKFELSE